MTSKMKTLTTALAASVALAACGTNDANREKPATTSPTATVARPSTAPAATVRTVTVDELDSLIGHAAAWIGDVNTDGVRASEGIIPGATLFASAADLPPSKDQKLVFYCYSDMCGASHTAAENALAAGYTDVSVLSAGIVGWKRAGKLVAAVR